LDARVSFFWMLKTIGMIGRLVHASTDVVESAVVWDRSAVERRVTWVSTIVGEHIRKQCLEFAARPAILPSWQHSDLYLLIGRRRSMAMNMISPYVMGNCAHRLYI
jgi:hypothetical protein